MNLTQIIGQLLQQGIPPEVILQLLLAIVKSTPQEIEAIIQELQGSAQQPSQPSEAEQMQAEANQNLFATNRQM